MDEERSSGQIREAGGRHGQAMGWRDKITEQAVDTASGVRFQYAALCWREARNGIEVLLITSRDSGRWIIPKGWPMTGLSPEATAAQEAWEEAGVEGTVNPLSVGRYGYHKGLPDDTKVPCAVAVYGLRVARLVEKYPEAKVRTRRWFQPSEASALVDEPDLAQLIACFVPPTEGRAAPIAGE